MRIIKYIFNCNAGVCLCAFCGNEWTSASAHPRLICPLTLSRARITANVWWDLNRLFRLMFGLQLSLLAFGVGCVYHRVFLGKFDLIRFGSVGWRLQHKKKVQCNIIDDNSICSCLFVLRLDFWLAFICLLVRFCFAYIISYFRLIIPWYLTFLGAMKTTAAAGDGGGGDGGGTDSVTKSQRSVTRINGIGFIVCHPNKRIARSLP